MLAVGLFTAVVLLYKTPWCCGRELPLIRMDLNPPVDLNSNPVPPIGLFLESYRPVGLNSNPVPPIGLFLES
jgi:hypothetical protein